jgi:hypothetical protein
MGNAPRDAMSSKRVAIVTEAVTIHCVQSTARGLLDAHKTVFLLLCAIKVHLPAGPAHEDYVQV